MIEIILTYVLEVIGAFIFWMLKGFKGKFSDEISDKRDANKKSLRNGLISLLFVSIIIAIIIKINN